ncbi:YjzD family protein [Cytobacillus sp. FJAT-54145]|uniref:YjzD family protein n=1 Tax=Cytobacillus spartinae TaxID=3299023 RepID=A0ABW6K828_9BACI
MQYFWTFFWTFLLIQMVTYVVSSMIGYPFNFVTGTILAVGTTILVFIASTVIPNEPSGDHGHH